MVQLVVSKYIVNCKGFEVFTINLNEKDVSFKVKYYEKIAPDGKYILTSVEIKRKNSKGSKVKKQRKAFISKNFLKGDFFLLWCISCDVDYKLIFIYNLG